MKKNYKIIYLFNVYFLSCIHYSIFKAIWAIPLKFFAYFFPSFLTIFYLLCTVFLFILYTFFSSRVPPVHLPPITRSFHPRTRLEIQLSAHSESAAEVRLLLTLIISPQILAK